MYQKIYTFAAAVSLLSLSACITIVSPQQNAATAQDQSEPVIVHADNVYTLTQPLSDFTDFILVKTGGDGHEPQVVHLDEALDDLVKYDVVFVGESHGHTANHLLQTKVFAGLYDRHNNMALSMEQFERDQQAALDKYLAGEIGESTLTKGDIGWRHYEQSYRPMVEFAKKNGLPVIAANAPAMAIRCIGMNGPSFLDTVTGEKRGWLAQTLNLQDGAYKDKYYKFAGASTNHSPDAGKDQAEKDSPQFKSFSAQVTRDDTMAESIYEHLQANPGRKVMHTNGSFHSAAMLGTVERLALRNPALKLANIHPVSVKDPDHPSFSAKDLEQGQYIVLITSPPQRFVKEENMRAFFKKTGMTMTGRKCEY
ncbi:MAG: ChaN family lipoprotein [Robiginitomaculum sp.]|nr:ChaN family lipoprotein [Robiginitomaculum sp.]